MVECDLAKVEVAGSNPVSRSSFLAPKAEEGFLSLPGLRGILYVAAVAGERPATADHGLRRGTQVVRERSAKPLCVGSIPTRASSLLTPSFLKQTNRQNRISAMIRGD